MMSKLLMTTFTIDDYRAAADAVRERTQYRPTIAMILGSGLGPLADEIENPDIIPYSDIPNMPVGTVHGHAGRFVIGSLNGTDVMVMQGRSHFYEGVTMQQIAFPIRLMQLFGIEMLIVTNAAGGVNTNFNAGDIMLIQDHITLPGLTGSNPLMGHNDPELGPRFTPMTHAYALELQRLAQKVAEENDIPLQKGVYCGVSGPMFETPAEIRMIRTLGGDAVGMSTVHEVAVANHGGMRVMGFSSITNVAIDNIDSHDEVSHEEVLEVGSIIVPRLKSLLAGVLAEL